MAGNVVEADRKALKILLTLDATRGEDSTGLAVVQEKGNVIEVYKKVGGPHVLFNEPIFNAKNLYEGPRGKVFIGHNRAATRGKVTDENAHPFKHDGVVGAHNGTLQSTHKLEKGSKFDVDSEAIIYNLSQYKAEDVIPNIHGAYALTWYDDVADSVFVIRNKERPLYWTRRKDKDVIFWASEEWMLEIALQKAGIQYGDVTLFEADKLYTLDVASVSPVDFRKTDWEDEGEVKGYVTPPVVYKPYKSPHVHNPFSPGGNRSNVVPFVGTQGTSSSSFKGSYGKEEVAFMKLMVDTDIKFKFSGVKKGVSKSEYLSAYPENINSGYDIRVYATNDKRFESWKKKMHDTTFKGKIKRVVENHWGPNKEVYFLIDLRSIMEVLDEPSLPLSSGETAFRSNLDDDDLPSSNTSSFLDHLMSGESVHTLMYEGFNGRYLTHAEWKDCTSRGCASCSEQASEFDCDMAFINHEDFLCGQCVDLYPEYVRNTN
jgi:predicted glutamine amidotransferase